MRILAFLQNQWFKDPQRVRAIMARHPDKRNELIARFLFAGCLSGKRLLETFGSEMCNRIVWEESSPEIGSDSTSRFAVDPQHINRAIEQHKPDVILTFGRIADDAVKLITGIPVIRAPHPAARRGAMEGLRQAASELSQHVRLATEATL